MGPREEVASNAKHPTRRRGEREREMRYLAVVTLVLSACYGGVPQDETCAAEPGVFALVPVDQSGACARMNLMPTGLTITVEDGTECGTLVEEHDTWTNVNSLVHEVTVSCLAQETGPDECMIDLHITREVDGETQTVCYEYSPLLIS